MYIYIYIYIFPASSPTRTPAPGKDGRAPKTAAPSHKLMDFRGFGSNIIFILRDEIPRAIWGFPERLSQAILAGTILLGRLGVQRYV